MWIVRLALSRPYTFIVLAILLPLMGGLVLFGTPTRAGMATDNREQASAIEEVRTAVRQLDEMTQHNAALAEQTNAAIEQTQAQAADLDRIVDVFVIEKSAAAGPEKSENARPKRMAAAINPEIDADAPITGT